MKFRTSRQFLSRLASRRAWNLGLGRRSLWFSRSVTLLTLAGLPLIASQAQAANTQDIYISPTSQSLGTAANWSLGIVPTSANDAVFGPIFPSSALTISTAANNFSFGSLNDTNNFALTLTNATTTATPSTLTLGGGSNTGNSFAPAATDLLYVGLTSSLTIQNGSTGALNLALGQSGNFDIVGTATISSVISGTGFGLTKTGIGILTLSGANTFTGGISLNAGTLAVTTSGALNSNTITFNGGTLSYSSSGDLSSLFSQAANQAYNYSNSSAPTTFATALTSASGSFTKGGTAQLTSTATNTYSGATTLNGGTLALSGANGSLTASTAINLQGGGLTLTNTGASGNNNNRISDTATITLSGGAFVFTGSDQTGVNSTETVGSFVAGAGMGGNSAIVTVTPSTGGGSATLTTGSITRSAGSIMALINGAGLGSSASSSSRFLATTAPTLVGTTAPLAAGINSTAKNTQIVTGFVGESSTTTGTGVGTVTGIANTFLTYTATGGFRPLNPTDEFTQNAFTTGNNTRITLATSSGTATINSLVIGGGAATANNALTLTGTMTNTSGMILFAPSAVTVGATISNGTVAFGANEGRIYAGATSTTATNLAISSAVTGSNGLTISGPGNVAISGAITLSGGTLVNSQHFLTLSSTGNNFSGASIVTSAGNGGILFNQALAAFAGASSVTAVNGSQIRFNGGTQGTFSNVPITLGDSSTSGNIYLQRIGDGADWTYPGQITLSGPTPAAIQGFNAGSNSYIFSGGITGTGTGGLELQANGGNAAYYDRITLSGTLNYTGPTYLSNDSNLRVALNATTLPTATVLNFRAATSSRTAQFDLNGNNQTIAGLQSLGIAGVAQVINSSAIDSILTVNNSANYTFAGNLGTVGVANAGGTVTNATGGSTQTVILAAGTSNGFSLVKNGSGTLTLLGAGSYTGGTTINAGLLAVGNTTALGATTGALAVSGGTLDISTFSPTVGVVTLSSGTIQSTGSTTASLTGSSFSLTNTGTVSAVLAGSGVLTKSGAGTATLSGANTYTGGTIINGSGTLRAGSTTAFGPTSNTLTLNSGTLDLNGRSIGVGILTGTGGTVLNDSGSGSVTLTLGNGNATGGNYSGVIANRSTGTGVVAVAKTGTGSLTLSGANTYSGGTTLSGGGTLVVGSDSVPNTPNAALTSGPLGTGTLSVTSSTLASSGTHILGNNVLVSSPTIGGTGALTLNGLVTQSGGAGTLFTLSNTALTTLSGGYAILDTGTTLNTFNLVGSGNVLLNSVISNGTSAAGSVSIGTTGTTPVAYSGVATFSGANTYTGTTTVASGILNIQNATALGTSLNSPATATTVASGATLQVQGGITVGAELLSLAGSGAPAGTGALENVSGTNNYGGLLTLAAAVTLSSDAGTLNLTNNGTITGSGFALTLAGAGNGSISSIIGTGAGSVTKNDAGTWILSGANTYTGVTSITGGTLTVSGGAAIADNGAVTLADAAGVTFNLTNSETIGSLAGGGGTGGNVTLGANALTLGGNNTSTTFSGVISGSAASGSDALIKNGTGTFSLAGTNTFTGQIAVGGGGTLQFGNNLSAFGSAANVSTIFVNNASTIAIGKTDGGSIGNLIASNPSAVATLSGNNFAGTTNTFTGTAYSNGGSFATNSTTAGAVIAFSNAAAIDLKATNLTVGGAGDTLFSGSIYSSTNTGNTVTKNGTGTLIYQANQGYTGETDINAGAVRVDVAQTNGGTYFVGNSATASTSASLLLGGETGGVTFNRGVSVNPGDGTMGNRVIGGTNTSGTNVYSGVVSFNGPDNSGQDRSITLTAAAGANTSGNVSFTGGITGGGVGVGQNVTKIGDGMVSFDSNTTYYGATTVNAGTLLINGTTNGTTSVTVNNSGSVLGGGGTLASPVTVNSGAAIRGGTGVSASGALTLTNSLTLNSGSIIQLVLGTSGAHSTLATNGSVMFDPTQTFTFIDLGADSTATYDNIITGLTSDPGSEANWTVTNSNLTGTFTYDSIAHSIDFNVTPVPEPATWGAGMLMLGALGYSQRRQVRRWLGVARRARLA